MIKIANLKNPIKGFLVALVVSHASISWSLPVFGEQTAENCSSCHLTMGELTARGRKFKLLAYAEGEKKTPFDALLSVSATKVSDTSSSAYPSVTMPKNGAVVPEGASLLVTGKFAENFGGKIKWTANNLNTNPIYGAQGVQTGTKVGADYFLDVSELRTFARSQILDKSVIYGFSLNNAPSQEDPWVSTPINSFPYKNSQLANAWGLGLFGPTTLIDGGLSSQTLGINAFAWIDEKWYVNIGNYWGLSTNTTLLDVTGKTNSLNKSFNPYYRLNWSDTFQDKTFMLGFFGMRVSLARDPLISGSSSSYRDDYGIDAVFQKVTDTHSWTAAAVWINENATWSARSVGRSHDEEKSNLNTIKTKLSYNYIRKYDVSLLAFKSKSSTDNLYWAYNPDPSVITGACNQTNSLLAYCSSSGKANTSGWGYELMYSPLPKVTIGFQQIFYNQFLGGVTFIDNSSGNIRLAKDNNLSYLYLLYVY